MHCTEQSAVLGALRPCSDRTRESGGQAYKQILKLILIRAA